MLGGAVHFFDEGKNSWSLLKDKVAMGPYHNIARYNLVHKVVVFGAGNGSKALYRLDAPGNVARLKDAPFPVRISSTVTAVDPATGDLLVLNMEDKHRFHALDVKANAWRRLPDTPISEGVAAPIGGHGVTLFFLHRPPRVFLYKHCAP